MKRLHAQPRAHAPGFSLAESLLAVAIVSFVLLAMIGVVPAGLASLRDSERRAAEARICQTVLADFEGRTWQNLAAQPDIVSYFDDQGIASSTGPGGNLNNPTAAPTFAVRAMLIVRPEQGQNAMISGGLLPGESSASPFLRYVRIAITPSAQNPQAVSALQSALQLGSDAPLVRVYTFLLANEEADS